MTQPSGGHAAKVIAVTVAAAVGGFLFGFDSSVINGAVDSIQGHFELGSFFTGFAVAIALLGCAAGAWFAGQLADRWGRKKVMLLGSALFTISSIGSGLAFSVPDLMLWRVLGGLGIGIASVIAPTYISEIAPARYRGSLASLQQLAITLVSSPHCCPTRSCRMPRAAPRTNCGGTWRRGGGCSSWAWSPPSSTVYWR